MGVAIVGILLVGAVAAAIMWRFAKNPHGLARAGRTVRLGEVLRTNPEVLEAPDGGGETPLMHAAKFGETGTVSFLLEKGANPNAVCQGGGTPLMLAAAFGYADVIQKLLRAGAHPDASDADGVTPLHYAADGGHIESIKALLHAGADRSLEDAAGRTAARVAAERQHTAASAILEDIA